MTVGRSGQWLVIGTLVLAFATTASAATDAEKCEVAKLKLAGKYFLCRLKAEAKAIKAGDPVDYTTCNTVLSLKWAAEEVDGAGMCPTSGDVGSIQSCLTLASGDIATALGGGGACGSGGAIGGLPETGATQCDDGFGSVGACPGIPLGQDGALHAGLSRSYTDNGDGTITDDATGLTWEKLSDDGSVHDKDNTYTWYDAFNIKVASLNGTNFAGYSDWRLPNQFELYTLLDLGRTNPAVDPAFNSGCVPGCTVTTCSCTKVGYWSSTPAVGGVGGVWYVLFDTGSVFTNPQGSARSVRAVRGGP